MHNLTHEMAMQRLCELTEKVMAHIGYDHPTDCFCKQGGLWDSPNYKPEDYRNDGVAIEFIRQAVQEKIEREPKEPS